LRLFTCDITVDDLHEWHELVFDSCTECSRCSMAFPIGINIARGVNVMREALSEAGLLPLELMVVAQAGRGTVFSVGPAELLQTVEAMRAQLITIPLDKPQADVMLVSTVIDVLLFQDSLAATARILNHLGMSWTLRSAGFEAANFGLLSGNEALQKTATKRLIDEALAIGARTVILPECSHGCSALRGGRAGWTRETRYLSRCWRPPNLWVGKCKMDGCRNSRAMPARPSPTTTPAS
jgi:Fe-S oxidoreductase